MITTSTLAQRKAAGEKITMLTAYDATFAHWLSEAGVDIILIGDSLGMTVQGHNSTVPVTVNDIAYHTQIVARGAKGPLLLADMPFMACATLEKALNATQTLMQAGANMVKLEGGKAMESTIRQIVNQGVPVCGHLGLTPQSVNLLGGYRVQGRSEAAAKNLEENAEALVEAGISLLVLECVPAKLAQKLTEKLAVPIIGIGAGGGVDGQVLVLQDMLGLTPKAPRFSHNFLADCSSIQDAIKAYVNAVKAGAFPSAEHAFN